MFSIYFLFSYFIFSFLLVSPFSFLIILVFSFSFLLILYALCICAHRSTSPRASSAPSPTQALPLSIPVLFFGPTAPQAPDVRCRGRRPSPGCTCWLYLLCLLALHPLLARVATGHLASARPYAIRSCKCAGVRAIKP